MTIKHATFDRSFSKLEQMPKEAKAEFAFIGRSNVGKSSLINALCNNKQLAKTSSNPGKTMLINRFDIDNEYFFIDLPGYGYAKRSKKLRNEFEEMISAYLAEREQLICTFILIDSRIPPQKIDLEFINWCGENDVPLCLVFTKADKVKTNDRTNVEINFKEALKNEGWQTYPKIIFCSALKKEGLDEILNFVKEYLP